MSTFADRIAALSPEQRALLRQRLEQRRGTPDPSAGVVSTGDIPRRDPAQPLLLSHAQERLWFLNRLQRGHAFYNIPLGLDMRGVLDIGALRRALVEITRRHEVLRTTFRERAGRPEQVVHDALAPDFALVDLCGLAKEHAEQETRRLATAEAARPFDLDAGPLLRATVVRLSPERHTLLMSIHHTVADGWSRGVLIRELETLYGAFRDGRPAPLPALPIQYGDFAVWQRSWLSGARLEREISYWRERLDGLSELKLVPDRLDEYAGAHRGAKYLRVLPMALMERVRDFARAHRATPFMTLLAAFKAYLHRISGQDDVAVGVPTANRNWPETEPLIGFFVNSLVMRTDVGGDPSFRALLDRVRETAVGAFEHRNVPFEKVVEELRPDRILGRNPLFQVTFQFQDASYGKQNSLTPTHDFPGLEIERLKIDQGTSVFDLSLNLGEIAEGLGVLVEYSTDLWDEARIARMVDHLATLLDDALRDPERPISRLRLTTPEERRELLALAAPRPATRPTLAPLLPVHLCVSQHARLRPEAPALVAARETLTYRALDRASNRLAHHLVERGLPPESVVGLCLDREPGWVVAALAVLKAGCAYLTLDPADPARRRQAMLEDAGVTVVLTKSAYLDDFADFARTGPRAVLDLAQAAQASPADAGDQPPPQSVASEQLAYVVYTSGSTGVPKGVGVPHGALCNLLAWHQKDWPVTPDDRGTCLAGLAFDPAVWEVWAALAFGAALHLPDEDLRREPRRLATWLADERITFAYAPTPLAERLLLEHFPAHTALQVLFVGGDRVTRRPPPGFPCPFVNVYGPAENAVNSTAGIVAPISDGFAPHIGRPIDNVEVYVLDRWLEPVPIGVMGELYLGGEGQARGYLGQRSLTAERFVPDPFSGRPGRRLYRTGDRVRMRSDGTLDFVGRNDGQVKVRGARLELGEVEAALRSHPEVREAVVLAKPDGSDKRLVAYVAAMGRKAPLSVQSPENAPEVDVAHVQSWQQFYETAYGEPRDRDRNFDTVGWNSSYDGAPIPAPEMRAWLDETIERIEELAPRRILEIGCGTGMLLFRLAPACERYCATDFSRAVIAGLRAELATPGRAIAGVELIEARADEVTSRATGSFDVVILNSVVQYFPSVAYFEAVLASVLSRVAPGGAIFLGDLRHAGLERLFHASVAITQGADADSAGAILQRIDELATREQELLLAPTIFPVFASRHPRISRARVRPKRHAAANELSQFRYDVVLELDRGPSSEPIGERSDDPRTRDQGRAIAVWDWDAHGRDLDRVCARLRAESPASVILRGVPNARLGAWSSLLAALEQAEPERTLGALRAEIAPHARGGVEPARLWALGSELPYAVDVSWARGDREGRLDVLFHAHRSDDGHLYEIDAGRIHTRGVREGSESLAEHVSEPAARRGLGVLASTLRAHVAEQLPDYMVPDRVIVLPSLPLNNRGKVDRARLLALDVDTRASSVAYVAPRDALESEVAAVFGRVLGVERVGARDDFFDLGGHSLLATQVVAALEETTGIRLDLRVVFTATTVEGIAGALRTAAVDKHPMRPIPRCTRHPRGADSGVLSFGQQRLWFVEQLLPGTAAYNMPAEVRIEGHLDVEALRHGLEAMVQRHEALRTSFVSRDGEVVQVVAASAPLELQVLDLRDAPQHEVDEVVRREAVRPFDIAHAPLLRALLVRLAADEHRLVITMHHIVSDGWSVGVFIREFSTFYRARVEGRAPALPELPISYRDYAAWQRDEGAQDAQPEAYAYWNRQLTGAPRRLGLPTDRTRPAQPSFAGAKYPVALGAALSRQVDALAQRTGTTRFMVLLAAWNAVLHHHAGSEDIVVVSPVAGRRRSETHNVIGFFVNWLALRTHLHGDPSFRELLDRVRQTCLGALEHQDVPFERVIEQLRLRRDLGTTPFAQVAFALQNAPAEPIRLPGLEIEAKAIDTGTAKTDLTLLLDEPGAVLGRDAAGFSGVIEYATRLFDEASIAALASDFIRLLERVLDDPDLSLSRLLQNAELSPPRHRVHCSDVPPRMPEPIRFYGSTGARQSTKVRWRTIEFDARRAAAIAGVRHDLASNANRAASERVDPPMALTTSPRLHWFLTVLAAYLHRISGQREVAIAVPQRRRNAAQDTASALAPLVPIVFDIAPDASFRGLLAHVEACVAAVLEPGAPATSSSFARPTCDVAAWEQEIASGVPGDTPEPAVPADFERLSFALHVLDHASAGRVSLRVGFHDDIFDDDLEHLALGHMSSLIDAFAANPDLRVAAARLEPAPEPAAEAVVAVDTEPTVLHAFDRWRNAAPEHPALIDGEEVLSYRALDQRVWRLAHCLRALGARPETVVAFAIDRRQDAIVALLAVLRTGAAYLPIESNLPPARVTQMLARANVHLVVADASGRARLPQGSWQVVATDTTPDAGEAAEPEAWPWPAPMGGQVAYIMFTSGTTGEPKGVTVEHRALAAFAAASAQDFALGPGERMLQFASLGFDVSVEEIFAPLIAGAAIVLRDDDMVVDPERFLERCRHGGVTVLHLPTAYWQTLVAVLDERRLALPDTVRLLIVGGERLTVEAVQSWRGGAMSSSRTATALLNSYGPTETTVSVTVYPVPSEPEDPRRREIPIGVPFAGARLYVVDPRTGRPTATGVAGELWIGGPGVARGYVGRPGLTAERFVPDPFSQQPGARVYRSGDLVRRRSDGALEFIGRVDRQVKVRGFRIELEEVERALRALQCVTACAVLALPAPGDVGLELVAFVTPAHPDADALRSALATALPSYMLPNRWVFLDVLPLDGHGKVDRRALQSQAERQRISARGDTPARDEVERQIAEVWAEALGLAQVGVHQNFFELGGSSLLLLQIHPRLRDRLGASLQLVELFQYPTIHLLAQRLRDRASDDGAVVRDRANRRRAAARQWHKRGGDHEG